MDPILCRWLSLSAACLAIFIQSGMAGSQTTTLMEQVIFQADDIRVDHIEPLVSTLNATDVQVLEGNNITWTAVIDGHSAAKFIVWYDREGQPIFNSSRFQIRAQVAGQQTISCLTVIGVNRWDQGVYRFTASIKDRVQCLNFTLRVVGRPMVRMLESHSTFDWGQPFVFNWQVDSYPSAEIYLSFEGAPTCPTGVRSFNQSITCTQRLSAGGNDENIRIQRDASKIRLRLSGYAKEGGEYLLRACNRMACSSDFNNVQTIEIRRRRDDFQLHASAVDVDRKIGLNVTCITPLNGSIKRITWFWTPVNRSTVRFSHETHPPGIGAILNKNETHLVETLVLSSLAPESSGNYTCQVDTFLNCGENIDTESSEEYDESEETFKDSFNKTISIEVIANERDLSFDDVTFCQTDSYHKSLGPTNNSIDQYMTLRDVLEDKICPGKELTPTCHRQGNYLKLYKIAGKSLVISTCNHTFWLVVNNKSAHLTSIMISDDNSSSEQNVTLTEDNQTVFHVIVVSWIWCPSRTNSTYQCANINFDGTVLQQFVLEATLTIKKQTVAIVVLATILVAAFIMQAWRTSILSPRIFFSLSLTKRWKPSRPCSAAKWTCNLENVIEGKFTPRSQDLTNPLPFGDLYVNRTN